jgi:hypothetical protein
MVRFYPSWLPRSPIFPSVGFTGRREHFLLKRDKGQFGRRSMILAGWAIDIPSLRLIRRRNLSRHILLPSGIYRRHRGGARSS